MADSNVPSLGTPAGGLDGADELYVVDKSDTTDDATGSSKKTTVDDINAVNDARTKTLTNTTLDANGTGNSISNIDLSTDVTGSLPIGDINASGTASSSTFLRGDGSWAAPAGGGGGDLLAANNLSDLASAATSRTNLGVDAAGTDNAPAASATVAGKVELATPAEATTGTDTTRAVTPEGLKTVADTKAASSHNHAASDVNSGTFADARIAASNVTQHQAALSITESQVSDLGTYASASDTVTSVEHGATAGTARPTGFDIVIWNGSVEPTNASNGDLWVDTA